MIIFVYGEDLFRSSQKIAGIKDRFLASDRSGSGLSVFDQGSSRDALKRFIDALGTPNLLAPKRLVILRNFLESAGEGEKDELLKYLEEHGEKLHSDKDLVAIFQENIQPKKNGKLYKLLLKISKSQSFERLSGIKLEQWIVGRMKEIDPVSGISKGALAKLIAYAGNSTGTLDKEIRKLVDFTDGKIISEDDIDMLVKADSDTNIFETIDALGANNKKKALRLLQAHLRRGEDPFQIFSMFVYQFRNLLKVADLKDKCSNNEYAIAKESGLHPFVVKKSLAQARSIPFDKLVSIYQELGRIDRDIKTGKIEIRLALEKFIAEL